MLRSQLSQKGIWRFQQILNESYKIANTRYGAIFRNQSIPFLFPEQYIITDYKLASLILSGDHEKKIKESIKRNIFTSMNLIDRKVNNLFTSVHFPSSLPSPPPSVCLSYSLPPSLALPGQEVKILIVFVPENLLLQHFQILIYKRLCRI
jgi:hypothetical protein